MCNRDISSTLGGSSGDFLYSPNLSVCLFIPDSFFFWRRADAPNSQRWRSTCSQSIPLMRPSRMSRRACPGVGTMPKRCSNTVDTPRASWVGGGSGESFGGGKWGGVCVGEVGIWTCPSPAWLMPDFLPPTSPCSPPPKLLSLFVLETNTASLRRINRHAR